MSNGAIELHCLYSGCQSCGIYDNLFTINVREVEANARVGEWKAQGEGFVGFCPRCGAVSRRIAERVPVELEGLPCPTCHQTVNYKISLQCVTLQHGKFEFIASVACPGCARTSVVRRMFNSLKRIKRVQVGPTGVELELTDGHT